MKTKVQNDRHRTSYIPFRCSDEMGNIIDTMAQGRGQTKSEVLRYLVEQGLIHIGATVGEDHLRDLVRSAVAEEVEPRMERIVKISAKATQITSAAFFMSVWERLRDGNASNAEIEEAVGTARKLGIQFLKLKDDDLDRFLQHGTREMMDSSE